MSLLCIAVLPTFVIFFIVIKNARAAREPFKKIAKVFGISVVSTIVAMILEALGEGIEKGIFDSMGSPVNSMLYIMIETTFVVALVEEGCKYFSFKLMIFHDRAFDNTYDGLIYGAASALGFATLENILYVVQYGFGTGILRAVLSVPMHACTGIFMGYYFGISKYKKYNDIQQDKNPQRRAYVISVVIHALYDFLLMANDAVNAPEWFPVITVIGILIIMVIVYAMMILIIKKAKREDQPIYNRYYYEHLNGAYQDMRGTTSDKEQSGIPVGAMSTAAIQQPYGQPMPGQQMAQPQGQPMNTAYPQNNMPMNGMQANMPNGYGRPNVPPQNGYGAPMRPQGYGYSPMGQNAPPIRRQSPVGQQMPTAQAQRSIPMDNSPVAPAKYCGECGNKLENQERICPVCGSRTN